MSTFEIIFYSLLVIVFPGIIYVSVKLGTYAFFRARFLFHRDHEGDRRDGKEK